MADDYDSDDDDPMRLFQPWKFSTPLSPLASYIALIGSAAWDVQCRWYYTRSITGVVVPSDVWMLFCAPDVLCLYGVSIVSFFSVKQLIMLWIPKIELPSIYDHFSKRGKNLRLMELPKEMPSFVQELSNKIVQFIERFQGWWSRWSYEIVVTGIASVVTFPLTKIYVRAVTRPMIPENMKWGSVAAISKEVYQEGLWAANTGLVSVILHSVVTFGIHSIAWECFKPMFKVAKECWLVFYDYWKEDSVPAISIEPIQDDEEENSSNDENIDNNTGEDNELDEDNVEEEENKEKTDKETLKEQAKLLDSKWSEMVEKCSKKIKKHISPLGSLVAGSIVFITGPLITYPLYVLSRRQMLIGTAQASSLMTGSLFNDIGVLYSSGSMYAGIGFFLFRTIVQRQFMRQLSQFFKPFFYSSTLLMF